MGKTMLEKKFLLWVNVCCSRTPLEKHEWFEDFSSEGLILECCESVSNLDNK